MRVVHVTSWLSRRGGGIPPVVWALARESSRRGVNASVVGLKDEWTEIDFKSDGFQVAATDVLGPQAFGFSPGLRKQILMRAEGPGVIHSHGLWMYPGLAARKCADRKNFRLVISPHGMLEPWALNHSRWKKKLVERLFERQNLRRADCLHALCHAEAESFRRYGLKNPIAIIPNGVGAEEIGRAPAGAITAKFREFDGRHRILFLSRLHPKKGLETLLRAWSGMAAGFKDWQLVIAGSGEPAYEKTLKDASKELVSNKRVVFAGPIYGEDKRGIMAAADAFVLPSFSEGFSMAVLEACAAALPVLLTRQCNFPELVQSKAGIEIPTDVSGIECGMRQMLKLSEDERKAMGLRGQALVAERFVWPRIAEQMKELYDWIVLGDGRPDCVYRD